MQKPLIAAFIVMLFSIPTLASAASFSDVKSPVLQEAVEYLNDQGVIKGYDDGTFRPDQVINRAEALKIIFESRGIAVEEDTNSGFPDVERTQWFAKYVTSAKRLGLIKGYEDGTYKPTQEVNKAEFIKIAMLAQEYYQVETDFSDIKQQYSDLDASAWYMPYVAFGHKNQFLDRVSKLHPTDGMTRGEAALIIYQVAQYNQQLAANVEEEEDQSLEDSAVISCETCVNGVDLSQYEWSADPFVKIKDGKLYITEYDDGHPEFKNGNVTVSVRGENNKLTENSEQNILHDIERTKLYARVRNTPVETKHQVDELYPEFWERAIGIQGGKQVGDQYLESQEVGIFWKNKDAIIFEECECQFELDIINYYNGQISGIGFFDWIESDDGREIIYGKIQFILSN